MKKIISNQVVNAIESGVEVDFSNHEVEGDIIVNLRSNRSINLKNSKVNGRIIIETTDYADINLEDGEFLGKIIIHLQRGRVNLKSASFHGGINIRTKDASVLDLSGSKLSGVVDICDSKISTIDLSNIEFSSKTEDDKFIFKHNKVNGKTNASKSTFQNATFSKTTFESIISFDNSNFLYSVLPGSGNFFDCIFEKDSYWNNVSFDQGCFFNGSFFGGVALFVGLNKEASCVGDFSGVKFKERCFFDNSKFESIAFHNCEFADVASFRGFHSKELEVSKAIFSKGSDFLNARIKNADKETFRIIKNEFLKINNQVEALHYRSKEMKAYEKELRNDEYSSERFLLWVNRISNEYGLNWFRGVKFTIGLSIVFYFIYLLTLNRLPFYWGWVSWSSFWQATGDVIKYFFRFFLPTHYLDFMDEFRPTAVSFFVDIVSRIFIGFGIYQTIQAFRKFGRD